MPEVTDVNKIMVAINAFVRETLVWDIAKVQGIVDALDLSDNGEKLKLEILTKILMALGAFGRETKGIWIDKKSVELQKELANLLAASAGTGKETAGKPRHIDWDTSCL